MPTTIDSAGITFNDATSLTSAVIPANAVGTTQIANGSVTASKLGTNEQKQICKAWVNFSGTTSPGTIRSSYNVSSITRTSTGKYTVNFTTPMVDVNYTATVTSEVIGSLNSTANPFSISNVTIETSNDTGAYVNNTYVCAQVFGN